MHYDAAFYASINAGSRASARRLCPMILDLLPVASVLDVGCGQGAWLEVWREHGARVVGVDGEYVRTDQLLIDTEDFVAFDLSEPLDLKRRFDLVQSLEVAEHIPESHAEAFVDNLIRHGDVVLFSAAVPGQGGTNHINEKPLEWWRRRFADRGYRVLDPFRRRLLEHSEVRPWYQYNVLLYVAESRLAADPVLAALAVPEGTPLTDVSPPLYQLRKRILAPLPVWVITQLARVMVWLASVRPHSAAVERMHRL